MGDEPLESTEQVDLAVSSVPFEPRDLVPAYANGAIVNHSDHEFTLTFLRAEHLLAPPGEGVRPPVAIATRVVMAPVPMKEFLEAAIDNYGKLRERQPGLPELKVRQDETDA